MAISSALGSSALLPAGLGFRNLIMNGDFRIAQRGTSFVSGANNDDTYNLDRWTILSDGNDAVDITQATDVPTGGLNSIGLDVETANKKFGIIQFIENQNIVGIQNKTVQLTFKARTTGSSISNVKAVVLSWTGTADSVTSDVVSAWGADGVTPTWATNWTAENTPANLGVTNTWGEYRLSALMDTSAIKNVAVFIWCDDTSTTLGDFLYITDVQLERNLQPTPFEQRPIGVELALCQRYCQLVVSGTGLMVCNGSAYTSSAFYGIYHNKSSMRVAPTAVISTGTGHWFLAGNNNQHSFSTIAMDVSGTETVRFSATSGITINQGSAYWLQSNNAASSIVLSAEL
jgi:hypothetical protein